MSFTAQIGSFGERAAARVQTVRRAVVMKLFSSVILDTPVDTGRLRGNWQVSEDAPITSEIDREDKTGAGPISEVERAAKESDGDTPLFLSNNLPYAGRIEFEGHSSKAPEGMVRRNVARFGRIISVEISKK